MFPVRQLRVNNFSQKYQKYVWYQDYISLEEHSLVSTLQFGETETIKLKCPKKLNRNSGIYWEKK